MINVVLFGGNGYVGSNFVKEWLAHGPANVHFYVFTRTVTSRQNDYVTDVKVDVTDEQAVLAVLPERVDYIIDFVGAPSKNPQTFDQLNYQPARVMQTVAEQKHVRAMGFIGGILGPRKFTHAKKKIIKQLQASSIPLAVVEPTLIYGASRNDAMTRNVPFLKFLGLFLSRFKPVLVTEVVNELREQLLKF